MQKRGAPGYAPDPPTLRIAARCLCIANNFAHAILYKMPVFLAACNLCSCNKCLGINQKTLRTIGYEASWENQVKGWQRFRRQANPGKYRPPLELAAYYGVSVDYLMGRTNVKKPYPEK